MPIKLKDNNEYDYLRHAKQLVESYLNDVNKGKQQYTVTEEEIERVANELKENNGMLINLINIIKVGE